MKRPTGRRPNLRLVTESEQLEMNPLILQQPKRLFFGPGCVAGAAEELNAASRKRVFVITSEGVPAEMAQVQMESWKGEGLEAGMFVGMDREPDLTDFHQALQAVQAYEPDAIVGFGGGSALDVAKLVAALWNGSQKVEEVFGIGLVKGRETYLACIPTTAGTGADVSPNSIILDEGDKLKKGVVSPHLVPDASFVDPELTLSLPPSITAATGYDALVHCMEAYANLHAHPVVDAIALEGIRQIGGSLERAVENGSDLEARTHVMHGAMNGGLCLGPVNTAAVHALAYPLGGAYHVAHGVSNSLLTPAVFRFNLPAAPERYAGIARALGVGIGEPDEVAAERGLARLEELSRNCGIPQRMRDFGVPEEAIPILAGESMKVTRLLRNNPRRLSAADAEIIYREAW